MTTMQARNNTKKTVIQILESVKLRLSSPNNWTRGVPSRDKKDKPTKTVWDFEACKFCIHGAFHAAVAGPGELLSPNLQIAMSIFRGVIDGAPLATYNEATTYPKMMHALDQAIKLAKESNQVY